MARVGNVHIVVETSNFEDFLSAQLAQLVTALGIDPAVLGIASPLERADKPALFVVWIDMNFGGEFGPAEWVANSPPKPLGDALAEAEEARNAWRTGGSPWICKVCPEGVKP